MAESTGSAFQQSTEAAETTCQPATCTIQTSSLDKVTPDEVRNYSFTCPSSKPTVGGRLKQFYENWCKITSDCSILNAVQGYKIDFDSAKLPPLRKYPPFTFKCSEEEEVALSNEIQKLYGKNVIEPCQSEEREFVSNIFSRPKKNGGLRLILDLSDLNNYLPYQHFKMENVHTARQLITQNSFLASVDLQDAYYSVPIYKGHRKYLKFLWQGQHWQFKALPNGLCSGP